MNRTGRTMIHHRRLAFVLVASTILLACNSLAGRIHELIDGGAHLHEQHVDGQGHPVPVVARTHPDPGETHEGLLHLLLHEASCCGQMAGFNVTGCSTTEAPGRDAPGIPHALGLPRSVQNALFKPPIA